MSSPNTNIAIQEKDFLVITEQSHIVMNEYNQEQYHVKLQQMLKTVFSMINLSQNHIIFDLRSGRVIESRRE